MLLGSPPSAQLGSEDSTSAVATAARPANEPAAAAVATTVHRRCWHSEAPSKTPHTLREENAWPQSQWGIDGKIGLAGGELELLPPGLA